MADYTDRETVEALGIIDPELDKFLSEHGENLPKADWSDVKTLRANRVVFEATRKAKGEEAKLETSITIRMSDGHESEILIHKPADPPAKSPLVVLLFGGGFIMGSNVQLGPYARGIAKLYGATVVTPSYRLAPEHRFPTQANDIWDTLQWLTKNAASLGADLSAGFVLGGVSAGGQLAAVTAQRMVTEKTSPPLTGLWLSIPVLFNTGVDPPASEQHLFFSREQNAHAPIFNMQAIEWVEKYMEADPTSSQWSPFNGTNPHVGMPRTYFQVCGMDPLRDDGLIYERVLRQNGVPTKISVYPGVPHGHFSSLPFLKISQRANADVIENFGWLLGKEASREDIAKAVAAPGGA